MLWILFCTYESDLFYLKLKLSFIIIVIIIFKFKKCAIKKAIVLFKFLVYFFPF